LTNVGKRPDNFEFSETYFRSHAGRGKILKVVKAQANGIICPGMTDKYL
jgi:UDP-N-acetylglucosamine transferase subunit ALG13